ncbi:MAG: thioesterase family protein [Actinobacteria bacterium]|nr:thioesterase family protein [Actinomycetota bacterium]
MQVQEFEDPPIHNPDSPFLDRLSLKRVDRDIFTGWCHAGAPLRAFGGQVAAQALVAAGTTVEESARHVHSLHGYFLRPGRTSDHIVYTVDRPRDGRSFSTRRVRAVQYGETIFTMSASFAPVQDGPSHQATGLDRAGEGWFEDVPRPDEVRATDLTRTFRDNDQESRTPAEAGLPEEHLIDIRFIHHHQVLELTRGRADQMAWIRTREPLPDNSLIHACALTYFSDLTLVGTVLSHHGGRLAAEGHDLASIDHAMWFHQEFLSNDWLLFVTDSPISGGGHGFARGQFFDSNGALVASAAQEVLIRARTY